MIRLKFRRDFVTNSSSSSYVCEICGRTESGWDLGLDDAEMYECVNGHIFCWDEALPLPSKKKMIQLILQNKYNSNTYEQLITIDEDSLFEEHLTDGGCYAIPECMCPICQFIEYSEYDLSKYLLKKYQISREEVFAEVKKFNKRRRKLYENEYIAHVCKQFDLNPAEIVASWKEEFGTYSNFAKWLRGN